MYKLTIPKPCFQNWNDMIPGEGGRHCSSCSKTVTDFTSMSDEAIKQFFIANQGKHICGRFRNTQIDRIRIDLPANIFRIKIPYWKKFLVAFLVIYGSTFFGIDTTIAGVPFNPSDTIPIQDTIPLKDTVPMPDSTQLIDPVTHQPILQTETTDSLAAVDSLIPAEVIKLPDSVLRTPVFITTGSAICKIDVSTFQEIFGLQPGETVTYGITSFNPIPAEPYSFPHKIIQQELLHTNNQTDADTSITSVKENTDVSGKTPEPKPVHDQPLNEFILPATMAVKKTSKHKKA